MKTLKTVLGISAIAVTLSSCTLFEDERYTSYRSYSYDHPEYRDAGSAASASSGSSSGGRASSTSAYQPQPTVNRSSHRSGDKSWVNSQNPMGYTIEVADGDEASSVAGRLHSVPKSDRSAQVEYHQGGKTHYKGLYGSYQSKEAAEKAYQSLPEDVKAGAKVKSWGSVQGTVNH